MELPSKIQFADMKVKKAFEKLKSDSQSKKLFNSLVLAFNEIKSNAFCGIQIPKRLIPKEYLKKYKIKNLWKYNLTSAWRLLYSIESNEILVLAIILQWMNHKEYGQKMKY